MTSQVPPAPPTAGGIGRRALGWLLGLAMRLTLLVSPVPAALLVRQVFARTGAGSARRLAKHVPPGVSVITDERYGDGRDELLDVVRPANAPAALPLVVWILILACGPYSVDLAREASSPAGRLFIKTVMWAYSGKRNFLEDRTFRRASIVDNVSPAFPPALVTVGNADPLRQHSELLVARLRSLGAEVESVFWPEDHEPPLGHEYQFDLDADAGQVFLQRMVDFLARRTGSAAAA